MARLSPERAHYLKTEKRSGYSHVGMAHNRVHKKIRLESRIGSQGKQNQGFNF